MKNNKFKSFGNLYNEEVYAKTKKYQKLYGFKIGTGEHDAWNNESDAFKHTFASVDVSLKAGTHFSKYFGDIHEWQGRNDMGQTVGEENMDKWNNNVGRYIAREIRNKYNPAQILYFINTGKMDDIIAAKVVQRMRKGELITHPSDPRKYVESKSPSEKFSDEIRAKLHAMKAERNRRISGNNKPSGYGKHTSGSGRGHWVTINGRHVYLED